MSEKAKKQVMLTQYFDLLTPINPLQLQQNYILVYLGCLIAC